MTSTEHWLQLQGKTCVVTGAAGGIGRSISLELARAGAQLALMDLTAEACVQLHEEVRTLGANCVVVPADIASEPEVRRAAAQVASELGSCSVLVNTPAISGRPDDLLDLSAEKWARQFSINVTGFLNCAKAFVEPMRELGGGSMVHISSMAGHHPQPHSGAYSVTKASVSMMSRVLALECAGHRIRSNVVSPAMVRTPLSERFYGDPELRKRREAFVPLGSIGTPQQVAEAVVFLASPRAAYITGQDLVVDGGVGLALMGLFPRPS